MSKLRTSTLRCARSIAPVSMRASIASPSCMPSRFIRPEMRSEPKMRSRSSSSDR